MRNLALAVILTTVIASPAFSQVASYNPAGDAGGLIASGELRRLYIPPPDAVRPGLARKTATITVNFNPGTCPTPGTVAWPANARAAFQYAVDIWAAILNGSQTIEIDACWRNDMPTNTLGSAGAANVYRNFTNAPLASTYYPVALANELAGSDLNGGNAEISARFNSTFNWYFGTDGNPASNQYDFISTVLHEIGHGLGIAGSMNYDDGVTPNECSGTAGQGCYGLGTTSPMAYDRYTENNAGTGLISYTSPSTALGNQLTSDNVFFDAFTANFYNGGARVELYAPTTWNPGSSYSHLGEVFNGTENALMTFSSDFAEAIHYPGTVAIGILGDLGWDLRNLATVWVDGTYSGTEVGGPSNPFNTAFEGTSAVEPGGTVYIRPGNYDEQFTVFRPMIVRSEGGTAVIGQ